MKKRLIAMLSLICCLALLLCACGQPAAEAPAEEPTEAPADAPAAAPDDAPADPAADGPISEKQTPEDTLVFAIGASDADFEPYDAVNEWPIPVSLMFEPLLRFDNHGNFSECLATDWEWIDSTTLHFTLREGVTFSNGEELTAEDVMYSLERDKNFTMAASNVRDLDFEKSYYEGNEIYLYLTAPNADWLAVFAKNTTFIVPKDYIEENGDDYFKMNPIGSGPYVLTEFTEGESCHFTINENYWGEKPNYKNVTILSLVEESTRVLSFESGAIDVMSLSSTTSFEQFKGREAEGINAYNLGGCKIYNLNFGDFDEAMKNEKVRKAIAHAVDWEALVEAIWGDYAYACDSVLQKFSSFYVSTGTYAYDPDLSKRLLAEAGYPDGLTIPMAVASSSNDEQIATIMKAYLDQVGIIIDLTVTDNATARTLSSSGDVIMSFNASSQPTGYLTDTLRSTITGSNSLMLEIHTDFPEGAAYQELIAKFTASSDDAERKTLAEEIQAYAYEHCLWLPIAVVNNTYVARDYVDMSDYVENTYLSNNILPILYS